MCRDVWRGRVNQVGKPKLLSNYPNEITTVSQALGGRRDAPKHRPSGTREEESCCQRNGCDTAALKIQGQSSVCLGRLQTTFCLLPRRGLLCVLAQVWCRFTSRLAPSLPCKQTVPHAQELHSPSSLTPPFPIPPKQLLTGKN